ncbi:DUF7336 domain-containing protein [Streptomyces sp. NPDC002644]
MAVYVLTEGWYENMQIKGVVTSEDRAKEWEASGNSASYLYCRDYEEFDLDDMGEF